MLCLDLVNVSNDLIASAQTSCIHEVTHAVSIQKQPCMTMTYAAYALHAVLQVCDRGSGDVLVLARHLLDEFCMDCHPGFSVVLRVAPLHAERF